MTLKKKRGQEEIVGFVLIIVIVAVIFLVILGVLIRRGPDNTRSESSDVYQFLESSMEYTTICAFSSAPDYSVLGELFEECYIGNNCLNGINACQVLNETLVEILDSSWDVSDDGVVKGYELNSFFKTNSSDRGEEVIALGKKSCEGSVRGATYLVPAFPGTIEIQLIICS
jgi:hypothetical protein